jgi:hypothetical protein
MMAPLPSQERQRFAAPDAAAVDAFHGAALRKSRFANINAKAEVDCPPLVLCLKLPRGGKQQVD